METISISNLKTHLSSELKKVKNGTHIVILDHKHPVAKLIPTDAEELFISVAEKKYLYHPVSPITKVDPLIDLEEERSDRW